MTTLSLYAHEPWSLLPLMEQHLPLSLPLYGTIKSGPKDTSPDHVTSVAWATFPPDQLDDIVTRASSSEHGILSTPVWTIIKHLPEPMTRQTRLFCSAESALTNVGISGSEPQPHPATLPRDEERYKIWREGQRSVQMAISQLVETSSEAEMVGGLNTLWTEGVRTMLGTKGLGTCDTYLAPKPSHAEDESEVADMQGLALTLGREEDCELIREKRDIVEHINYYKSLVNRTSVIRRLDDGSPVGWILSHGAGDLGALYTMPEYRRRGLAKRVVQDRLRATAGMGIEGYVWVVEGNTASMALWRGMGWTRGWTAEWVNLRDPRTFKSKTDP